MPQGKASGFMMSLTDVSSPDLLATNKWEVAFSSTSPGGVLRS